MDEVQSEMRRLLTEVTKQIEALNESHQQISETVAALASHPGGLIQTCHNPQVKELLDSLSRLTAKAAKELLDPPGSTGMYRAGLVEWLHSISTLCATPAALLSQAQQAQAVRDGEEAARRDRAERYKAKVEEEARLHELRLAGEAV